MSKQNESPAEHVMWALIKENNHQRHTLEMIRQTVFATMNSESADTLRQALETIGMMAEARLWGAQ